MGRSPEGPLTRNPRDALEALEVRGPRWWSGGRPSSSFRSWRRRTPALRKAAPGAVRRTNRIGPDRERVTAPDDPTTSGFEAPRNLIDARSLVEVGIPRRADDGNREPDAHHGVAGVRGAAEAGEGGAVACAAAVKREVCSATAGSASGSSRTGERAARRSARRSTTWCRAGGDAHMDLFTRRPPVASEPVGSYGRPRAAPPRLRRKPRLVALVRLHHLLHQRVAHHVHLAERAEGDALHAPEDLLDLHQPAGPPAREVDLGDVAR